MRIAEVARSIIPRYNAIWRETTEEALAQMAEANVRINAVPDKESFMEAVGPVADQFFRMYPSVPRDLYKRIQNQTN